MGLGPSLKLLVNSNFRGLVFPEAFGRFRLVGLWGLAFLEASEFQFVGLPQAIGEFQLIQLGSELVWVHFLYFSWCLGGLALGLGGGGNVGYHDGLAREHFEQLCLSFTRTLPICMAV